ncbi:MAG: ribosomal-processing cysteine protease Prp [Acutalibacteraceae bacterium]
MIHIVFYMHDGEIGGFEISGHSTESADDFDGKLVCSAVSSAAIMAANTVTEILGDNSEVTAKDGYLKLAVQNRRRCFDVLAGLKLHLSELSRQYPDKIKLSVRE